MSNSDKETLLERRLRLNRPFTEMETLQIVNPMIENIRHVHATGKYHLRIRPEHITIDGQGNILVTNACGLAFPGASATDAEWEQLPKVKNKGFAGLEQRKWDPKNIGPWSDYYALGAVLCSMLGQDMSLGRKNELPEGTSPELAKFITSLMSSKPEKRMKAVESFTTPTVSEETVMPPSFPVPPVPPETSALMPQATPNNDKKKIWIVVGVVAAAAILVAAYFILMPTGKKSAEATDEELNPAVSEAVQPGRAVAPMAPADDGTVTMYPIVNVFLRSSPSSAGDANKVTLMEFGSKIVLTGYGSEWSNGTYIPKNPVKNAVEGYAATPFLISKRDYHLLDGMLANTTARNVIGTAKCRRALLDYYNDRGLTGSLDPEKGTRSGKSDSNQWLVQLTSPNGPNEVYMERVLNSRSPYTDFAVVLENMVTREHRLVYFRFDADETPHFVAEADIDGYNKIYSISKASDVALEYVVGDRYGNTETGTMYIQ